MDETIFDHLAPHLENGKLELAESGEFAADSFADPSLSITSSTIMKDRESLDDTLSLVMINLSKKIKESRETIWYAILPSRESEYPGSRFSRLYEKCTLALEALNMKGEDSMESDVEGILDAVKISHLAITDLPPWKDFSFEIKEGDDIEGDFKMPMDQNKKGLYNIPTACVFDHSELELLKISMILDTTATIGIFQIYEKKFSNLELPIDLLVTVFAVAFFLKLLVYILSPKLPAITKSSALSGVALTAVGLMTMAATMVSGYLILVFAISGILILAFLVLNIYKCD